MRTHFNGRDVYNVVRYSYQGKIVFPTAGLVIVQDPKPDTKTQVRPQTYFTRHTQDVISLAVHPKGVVMASGTVAGDKLVEIMVWDIETKALLSLIQGFHIRGVSHLAFSPDGTLLLSIGMDDDNSIGLYDWQANRLLCTNKVDKSPVYDIAWKFNNKFVTTGQRHFKLWTTMGRNLKSQYANFQGNYEPQTTLAYAFNYEIVSGSGTGYLTLWKGNLPASK
jgi:microtubule-associated protein-like 6